ncbi:MAG: PAS domain S-box protein [Thermodesulfobacteriota bacterium]|nr:PAS domain S-box protein [Thermodesulfobacteriota bacterium]
MINHEQGTMHGNKTERRILIVDDDRDFLGSLADIMKQKGYIVKTARSMNGARQVIKDFDAHIALIDLRLGRSSGMDLIGSLKKARPDILCVIVTGYADLETAIDALREGVYDYLRKPMHPHELLSTLDRCFDKLRLEQEKRRAETVLRQRNRELEEINFRLKKLVESASAMAACSSTGQMSPIILEEFTRILGADRGCLFFYDSGIFTLMHSYSTDDAPVTMESPFEKGSIVDRIMKDNRPILIEDIRKEGVLFAREWDGYEEGAILVFLLTDMMGQIRGLISLNRKGLSPFSEQDREVGSILASFTYENLRATRAVDALHASEAKYRAAIENTGTALAIIEDNTIASFVNHQLEKMTGYSKDELENKMSWMEFVHPEDLERMKGYHLKRRHEDETVPETYEFRFFHRDGTLKYGLVTIHLIPGTKRSVGSILDITERKRAEETIRQKEARYRLLADNLIDVIWSMDLDLRHTYVSPSVAKMRGYTVEEVMGQTMDEMLTPESREICKKILQEEMALERGGAKDLFRSRTIELEGICKDGSIVPTEVKVSFQRDSEGRVIGLTGVTRDISERKRSEKERAKIMSQLLQAQKMEAVGILAGGVAHDFNNLLTTIMGNTDLAMMNLDESDPSNLYLKHIQQASKQATNLTRQLLLFSRRQQMEPRPLNLSSIVENMLKMLGRLIGEDISIEADCDPDLWTVKADEGNTEQVLMNLCVNARDAMPEGGAIHIKTENITLDLESCRDMPEARPGKYVRLSVADTGVGMDEETVQRIFEPFFTTKGVGVGTGLGLSVVYGIVKEHKGWIEVQSEPIMGSTFRIYLPAVSIKVEKKTEHIISLEGLQGNGERILLVEDEEGVREFAVSAFRENGYIVFEEKNVKDALDIFEKEKGNFQLIFTDVVLPDQNGIHLVNKLLGRKPGLRVLLSSGYTDQKSHRQILVDRGFPYLQKPYSIMKLLKTVKDVLAQ